MSLSENIIIFMSSYIETFYFYRYTILYMWEKPITFLCDKLSVVATDRNPGLDVRKCIWNC